MNKHHSSTWTSQSTAVFPTEYCASLRQTLQKSIFFVEIQSKAVLCFDIHWLCKGHLFDIIPTDISWSPAGRGHDAIIFHLRQAEITEHDLGVFIRAVVEQILWLWRKGRVLWCLLIIYICISRVLWYMLMFVWMRRLCTLRSRWTMPFLCR